MGKRQAGAWECATRPRLALFDIRTSSVGLSLVLGAYDRLYEELPQLQGVLRVSGKYMLHLLPRAVAASSRAYSRTFVHAVCPQEPNNCLPVCDVHTLNSPHLSGTSIRSYIPRQL